jgi:hypothetical protein
VAVTGVVEESFGAAVGRGGGGVGQGTDRVAAHRPRPTDGGGWCGGQGSRRGPLGVGLVGAVLLMAAVG